MVIPSQLRVFTIHNSFLTSFCSENGPCSENGVSRLTHFEPTRLNRLAHFRLTDPVGRLEVCYNGYWGSVCNDFAGPDTAAVACRQLGYDVTGQECVIWF